MARGSDMWCSILFFAFWVNCPYVARPDIVSARLCACVCVCVCVCVTRKPVSVGAVHGASRAAVLETARDVILREPSANNEPDRDDRPQSDMRVSFLIGSVL